MYIHALLALFVSLITLKMEGVIPVTNFYIGEKFQTFDSFSVKLQQFQDSNFVQLYKRSSRKYDATKFQGENINSELKYSEIVYSCIHGGRNFISKSEGARPNQRYVFFLSIYKMIGETWKSCYFGYFASPFFGHISFPSW